MAPHVLYYCSKDHILEVNCHKFATSNFFESLSRAYLSFLRDIMHFNIIFIIMREFHDFEKIQIRSNRADLHHKLRNWNFQMAITYSNFVQTGHMRCFFDIYRICQKNTSYAQFGQNLSKLWPFENSSFSICDANQLDST